MHLKYLGQTKYLVKFIYILYLVKFYFIYLFIIFDRTPRTTVLHTDGFFNPV